MKKSNKNVLVIGDLIVDQSTYTKAVGLSLETPTIKTELQYTQYNIGGAANVARNVSALDCTCFFLTRAAKGHILDMFLDTTDIELMAMPAETNNIKNRIYVQHGDKIYKQLQINSTQLLPPTTQEIEEAVSYVSSIIKEIDVVAISDYRCNMLTPQFMNCLRPAIKDKPLYVASQVSDRKPRFEMMAPADYFCMNSKEYVTTHDVFKSLGCKGVYVTKGADGASLYLNNGSFVTEKAPVVNVVDALSAGDAFFAAVVCNHDDPIAAIKFATSWASLKVSKSLAELPTLEELSKCMTR